MWWAMVLVVQHVLALSSPGNEQQVNNVQDLLTSSVPTSPNIPEDFERVYPYFTDDRGHFVAPVSALNDREAVYWKRGVSSDRKLNRRSRHLGSRSSPRRLLLGLVHQGERLVLKLRPNHRLIARGTVVQTYSKVQDRVKRSLKSPVLDNRCLFIGRLRHQNSSRVAVDICGGVTGLIQTESASYFIQPLFANGSGISPHALYPIQMASGKKAPSLSGDEWRESGKSKHRKKKGSWKPNLSSPINTNEVGGGGGGVTTNSAVRIKDRFMSVAIAADYSLVTFHGSRVEQFILMLMNIVNAIYSDPSLGAKLTITVTRVILLQSEEESKVVSGNPRLSLEKVCHWFKQMNIVSPANKRHDIGIYLTRLDIGGPAGYAPVGGMCNHRRSCSLNRDEGLTSAFIIAHEVGHVLGFTHDGDHEEGNTCSSDGNDGSIMAPLVLATFNRFHWSNCTKQEYRNKINKLFCLSNKPVAPSSIVTVTNPLGKDYSLDEQCRLEFGEGFRLCRSFLLSDPCTHLWCSNNSTPLMCKTKKGPPLEGTPCGRGKWCVRGFCQHIKKKMLWDPIQRNPQHGGWGEWSPYGSCSRSCGGGVQFKTRRCNSPKPAYGGRYCVGESEIFNVCNTQNCPRPRDFRAEQCANLPQLVRLEPRLDELSWIPFPATNESFYCKLTCKAKNSYETFISQAENVIDGTPCSYDVPHHMCVQGQCQAMGCDGILSSTIVEDRCGICGGDNSTCKNVQKVYVRTPTKSKTRIAVLPRGARRIEVKEVSSTPNYLVLQSRRTGEVVLNGRKVSEASRVLVSEGAKFTYTRNNDSESIVARGPLLGEMLVMITPVIKGVYMMITVNYTIATRIDSDSPSMQDNQFTWDHGKWSRCSRSCGGGVQFARAVCRDRKTDENAKKRMCSLMDKPHMKRRNCNSFPCMYRWHTLEWEHCDHSCGARGVQHRQVYCTPLNQTRTLVDPELCHDGRPEEFRPCNRVPCETEWVIGSWSPCSATCGIGVKYRNITCISPDNELLFTCGEEKPENIRECMKKPCPETVGCLEDDSEFCQLQVLHRYCQIPSYHRLCCQSCNNHILSRL